MFSSLPPLILGAAVGATGRWLLGLALGKLLASPDTGLLAANWTGAFLIGIAAALGDWFPQLPPYWKLLFITGFLGSLTTFSGFSLEVVQQLQAQRYAAALSTAALHLFGSLALTALGMATVNSLRKLF
ncbi:MAG: fluoride efflux transporter CrcB [Neisseria sp.]|nr:fluoride efflux transporter CrcB [Neisseria sp.]